MKYIKVGWPEIQDYMDNPDYPRDCYYDCDKDCWFVPEDWEPCDTELDDNIENLDNETEK